MTEAITQVCCCEGAGFYFDRRCLEEVCAHRGETPKDDKEKRVKIMNCPRRTCSCKAGRPYREAIQERVRKQYERMDLDSYTR